MLDFSRITETISEIMGHETTAAATIPTTLLGALQTVGVDPSTLEGLTENQIVDLLAGYGIDPAQFSVVDIQGVLNGLGADHSLASVAASAFDMGSDGQDI